MSSMLATRVGAFGAALLALIACGESGGGSDATGGTAGASGSGGAAGAGAEAGAGAGAGAGGAGAGTGGATGGVAGDAGGGGTSGGDAGTAGAGAECAIGEYACDTGCCPWVIEPLSEPDLGSPASIAVDPDDGPHFVYRADLDGLMFSTRVGDQWELDPIGATGSSISLAIDSSGAPHVAFIDPNTANGSLVDYATRTDADWQTIPISEFSKTEVKITLGPTGPVFCHVSALRELFYAEGSTGTFVETRLCPSCGVGEFACAVNSAGEIEIVWDQDGWTANGPVPPPPWPPNTSFIRIVGALFDAEDRLHVAFDASEGLEWATYDGTWSSAPVGASILQGTASMTLAPNGTRHLVYLGTDGLTHAHFDGSAWHFSVIAENTQLDEPDIAVGSDGVAHVVYYAHGTRILYYARRD